MNMIQLSNGRRVTLEQFRAENKNVVFNEKPSLEFLESIGASFVFDEVVAAGEIRRKRNKRLSETDWRFRSDLTPSQEWVDYCQALRDITAQDDFPRNVIWPVKPE